MSTRWRATHALTVGITAGLSSFLETNHLEGSLLVGAVVAGLSGGAGALIRRQAGAPELDDVMAKIARLEGDMYELRSLVTAIGVKLGLELEQQP